jgi:CheY-like chemotaxis protein
LLVEDDKDSRDMLKVTLEIYGIRVEAAQTAEEAIAKLDKIKPDVIVSDIGLPEVDGYDLIRAIRSLPKEDGGQIPAIALTGYVSVQDRNLALKNGYQDHVPKPVNPNVLLELLAKLTSDRRHHAEV